jgi:hypothetical protein
VDLDGASELGSSAAFKLEFERYETQTCGVASFLRLRFSWNKKLWVGGPELIVAIPTAPLRCGRMSYYSAGSS